MATISYVLRDAFVSNFAGGVLAIDNNRSFDVGASLTAGSGTITVDAADTALVARLDSYPPLKRSGSSDTGTAPVTTRTGPLVVSRPEPATAAVGYLATLQADGTWSAQPAPVVASPTDLTNDMAAAALAVGALT